MKKAAIGILLLVSINLLGQTTNVTFLQWNCENDGPDWRERFLSIYKEDSLIVLHPKFELDEFSLKNLDLGDYKILFTNIYGQIIEEEILITTTTNEVKLCTDKFEETNKATIFSQLKKSDNLEIYYLSYGCDHVINEIIKFYQKNGVWHADYFLEEKKEKSKKLSKSDLGELIKFEKKLRQMEYSMGGCTTSENYIFVLNGKEQFLIRDESCDWDGYSKMKRNILGIKE